MPRPWPLLGPLLGALAFGTAGCVGGTRETLTARTPTEQLLTATAAERAISRIDRSLVRSQLSGRRVAIDEAKLICVDKQYVLGALRHYLCENGALLTPTSGRKLQGKLQAPERIVEIRAAALGTTEKALSFGIPPIPMPIPTTSLTAMVSFSYPLRRAKQEGWAHFQLFIYDPPQRRLLAESSRLWGHAYYSKWWFLFIGPFDFSNDIYPDSEQVPEPGQRNKIGRRIETSKKAAKAKKSKKSKKAAKAKKSKKSDKAVKAKKSKKSDKVKKSKKGAAK